MRDMHRMPYMHCMRCSHCMRYTHRMQSALVNAAVALDRELAEGAGDAAPPGHDAEQGAPPGHAGGGHGHGARLAGEPIMLGLHLPSPLSRAP